MYPVDVPGLLQSALIGANGSDPTIPYSPGWPRRLGSALWLIARREQRESPPAPRSTTSSVRRDPSASAS
jgi:hypothetical protein